MMMDDTTTTTFETKSVHEMRNPLRALSRQQCKDPEFKQQQASNNPLFPILPRRAGENSDSSFVCYQFDGDDGGGGGPYDWVIGFLLLLLPKN